MQTINVLLVDDHELVRTGIAALLNAAEGVSVAGIANSGEQGLLMTEQLAPDVVLMDVNMPGIGGVEACRRILAAHPTVKIIALSAYNDSFIQEQLSALGTMGFISKDSSLEEMVAAIHGAMNGEHVSNSSASNEELTQARKKSSDDPFLQLSKREMEVVQLTINGRTIQEMAQILDVSAKTISTYRGRINKKLKIKTEGELIRLAVKWNYY